MKITVGQNDTLGSIAFKYFRDSNQYRRILDLNPGIGLEVSPGQILELGEVDALGGSQLKHPEFSFDSRGGALGQRGNTGINILPWSNLKNYLQRKAELPKSDRVKVEG